MHFLAVGHLNNDRTIMSEAFAHIKLTLICEFHFILYSFDRVLQTYDIVYHDLRYRISWPTISYIMTHDIEYQPTISYINLRYRTYDIVYQPTISYINLRYRISILPAMHCCQPYSSKRKQSMSPNMPPTPLKRGRSLGQQEGPEALDMWCPQARGCLWQR